MQKNIARKKGVTLIALFLMFVFFLSAAIIGLPISAAADPAVLDPIAHYEFKDAENLGKDSAGNFDLSVKNSPKQGKGGEGEPATYLDLMENKDSAEDGFLYAEKSIGGKDFFDYMNDFTISLKLYIETDGYRSIIGTTEGFDGSSLHLAVDAGHTLFTVGGNGKEFSRELTLKKWTDIAFSYDKEKKVAQLYIDGQKIDETEMEVTVNHGKSVFSIGARVNVDGSGRTGFGSKIADVRVYDGVLSDEAIKQVAEGGEVTEVYTGKILKSIEPVTAVCTDTDTEEQIRAVLPAEVKATDSEDKEITLPASWKNAVIRKEGGVWKVTGGTVFGYPNTLGLKATATVTVEKAQELDPVAWYKFDDAENPGKDSMGNFDMTAVNGEKLSVRTEGAPIAGGKYISFSGNEGNSKAVKNEAGLEVYEGSEFGAPTDGILRNSTMDAEDYFGYLDSFTVSFWANTTNERFNVYMSAGYMGNAFQIVKDRVVGNQIFIVGGDGGEIAVKTPVEDNGGWFHMAVSYSAATGKTSVYIDGSFVAESEIKIRMNDVNSAFALGGYYSRVDGEYKVVRSGKHSMADVRVYDFALNAAQVGDVYNNRSVTAVNTPYIQSVVEDQTFVVRKAELSDTLPEKVLVVNQNGEQVLSSVRWAEVKGNKAYGYMFGDDTYVNVGISGSVKIEANLRYESIISMVNVPDGATVNVNGFSLTNGEGFDSALEAEIVLEITVPEGYRIKSVKEGSNKIAAADGKYKFSNDGNDVEIVFAKEGKVSVCFETNGGTTLDKVQVESGTTYGAAELPVPEKAGFVFDGWFADEKLANEIYSVDTIDVDMTLYAKWLTATEVAPLAWYKFDQEENLGLDSTGNFDLTANGSPIKTSKDSLSAIDFSADGSLTFPADLRKTDFFDRINHFTITFWANTSTGSAVLVDTGNNTFRIEKTENGELRIFGSGNNAVTVVLSPTEEWYHVAVSYNADIKLLTVYLDGDKVAAQTTDIVTDNGEAMFTVGSAGVKLADFRIFDATLGLAAVNAIYENKDQICGLYNDYISSYGDLETTGVNLVVSSTNSVDSIFAALPSEISAKTTGGKDITVEIYWYKTVNGDAVGIVYGQAAASIENKMFTVELSYSAIVNIGNMGSVTISLKDGTDAKIYASGEEISSRYGVEYILQVHAPLDRQVRSVRLGNEELTPGADGKYSFVFNGDDINVEFKIAEESCTITFDTLGGSKIESVTATTGQCLDDLDISAPVREGYTFGGWYTDESCTEEFGRYTQFTGDLKLYAKWTKEGSSGETNGCNGCSSTVNPGVAAGMTLLGGIAVAALCLRKKEDK